MEEEFTVWFFDTDLLPVNDQSTMSTMITYFIQGLGDPPNSSTSATRRAGAPRSGSQSRYNSAADGKNSAVSKGKSASKRMDDATVEEIKSMGASMSANDFRERQKGIKCLQEMCTGNPRLVNANIVKVNSPLNAAATF